MKTNPDPLPPAVFEAVVRAFSETLIRHYRDIAESQPTVSSRVPPTLPPDTALAAEEYPWLKVPEVAKRARCGGRLIYSEVRAARLRAVRVGGGRSLRFRAAWVDG